MIRILIATGLYPPEIGGPATYTRMLERNLPEHGIELVVAPYGWVRRYPKPFRHLVYAWKLLRESRDCDVMYALDPVSVGFPVYLVHKLTKKKYLLRVPGDYAWEQGQQRFGVTELLDEFVHEEQRRHPLVRLLKAIQRKVADSAKQIVVPSQYMKGIVSAWGIDPDKVTVIYSALYPLEVSQSREKLREMFDYKGVVIATAGRLVPWKGIETLVKMMPLLKEKIGPVTLVVMGDGPLKEKLQRTAQKLGVSDRVRLVGRMPKDTLGAAIKGADVFVLNTAYEGMSHQLLEVMDLGVPVVTTNVGGNPELISDGTTGLMVGYDNAEHLVDAIERIATHEQLREHVIQHARLRVKDFEEEKVVGVLVQLLREVV